MISAARLAQLRALIQAGRKAEFYSWPEWRALRPDVWKMSLRTGQRINASEVCRELGGGGHAAAAGCTVEAPWAEAKAQILAAVSKHAPDR